MDNLCDNSLDFILLSSVISGLIFFELGCFVGKHNPSITLSFKFKKSKDELEKK